MVVDVPKDVTALRTEYSYPKEVSIRSYNPVLKGHPGQIRKAVDLMLTAKKPMLYTGGGVILSGAQDALTEMTSPSRKL